MPFTDAPACNAREILHDDPARQIFPSVTHTSMGDRPWGASTPHEWAVEDNGIILENSHRDMRSTVRGPVRLEDQRDDSRRGRQPRDHRDLAPAGMAGQPCRVEDEPATRSRLHPRGHRNFLQIDSEEPERVDPTR
jgi:hypothetical protein